MSSDVVLTSALRSNLASLQNTQNLIDQTQLRLATGLSVNSALDGPSNFFAAQALDNRASDFSRLLDGISQSIRTIEEADNGITGLTSLVEQAQSIVDSARDELASSDGDARLVGTVDLADTADVTALAGINAGDSFNIITTDAQGQQITETITINAVSAQSLAATITDTFADNQNGEVTASLSEEGFLQIESSNGQSFRVEGNAAGTPLSGVGFDSLGIGDAFEDTVRDATIVASTTVIAGDTAQSISLFESSGNLAEAGDLITGDFLDTDGNTVLSGLAAGDTITLNVNDNGNTETATITLTASSTFQDVVDSINQDTDVNQLIEANFDSATGTISLTSLSDTVNNAELSFTTANPTTFDIGLGDPTGNLDPTGGPAGVFESVLSFNNSTESLDALAADFNTIRDQIDSLVNDAQFRGVNLLNGDDLSTFFNEDNSSSLTTEGAVFTANGLGITEATFRSETDIELSATQALAGLESVRNFGSSLANSLAIIQTREDFTQSTISTLQAGADDLTVADQNEEGANLLALQTRQSLGITSLSLASQSQQAVLQLF